ncbi:iron ABC transporter permease [Oceanotoga sp. DSM 15011]|uniref:FecCD family ABC transporter permease n=1 Tax=Oceanotoga sp. DSM 15011 TaxID=2984951 RepID=UPI0021F499F0|nr:iron ABC transporter permease [Oceanotoga sp. DSM 15011]UYP01328.1 iron ABC transporter permease [Oceanotoga sp. DSM 15011]
MFKINLKFYILSFINLVFLIIISLMIGRYNISFLDIKDSFMYIFNKNIKMTNAMIIILEIRLPRILMALLVGSSLAVSGTCIQAVFKNPLTSPKILGVSSGAAFGVAFGIMFFKNYIMVYITSFLFGIFAVFLTYLFAKKNGKTTILSLILSGIIVDSLFTSFLTIIQFNADVESELPSIIYWLMGSLSAVRMKDLKTVFFPIILCIILIFMLRWKLNILSLSDEEAESLGFNVKIYKIIILFLVTILSAITVSICGIIGWIGLVTPHFVRLFYGTDHINLIPGTIFFGGFYLLIIDNLSRSITGSEIPLSIMTAIIGAPLLGFFIKKKGMINL